MFGSEVGFAPARGTKSRFWRFYLASEATLRAIRAEQRKANVWPTGFADCRRCTEPPPYLCITECQRSNSNF